MMWQDGELFREAEDDIDLIVVVIGLFLNKKMETNLKDWKGVD